MESPSTGATLIAHCLKQLGVQVVFGVVGIPVIEVAEACRQIGIRFIAMRNEQSASYAANAWGYLHRQPGVCLAVSGPGFVHSLAGLANSQSNCWPMLLLAGSSDTDQEHGGGAFQELCQVEAARQYTKFSARPRSLEQLPSVLTRAFRTAVEGRPGPCYVDLPGDLIMASNPANFNLSPLLQRAVEISASRTLADPDAVKSACDLLSTAKRPLVIIGKGAAYAERAGSALRELVERYNIPFLPTPMAKGLLPDSHPNNVAAARSLALQRVDVAVIFGARLNWMLHFGREPRWNASVKIISVDISYEESVSTPIGQPERRALVGDILLVAKQILSVLVEFSSLKPLKASDPWWKELSDKRRENEATIVRLMSETRSPMTYYQAFAIIKSVLPSDVFLVSEGANTMDIGRTILDQQSPRSRLDAGSFGTMGVGVGYAIAAKLTHPQRPVVCIQGDSAFGFSAMELETVARLRLPILIIIINNSGIYSGIDASHFQLLHSAKLSSVVDLPSTALLPNARYEKIADAFGGRGVCVQTPSELRQALQEGLRFDNGPFVVNCLIEVGGKRRQQTHSWLTRNTDGKL